MKHKLKNIFVIILLLTLSSCCNSKCENKKDTEDTKEKVAKVSKPNKTVTLGSGLSYMTLKTGNSKITSGIGKKITVHYAGWIADNSKPNGKGNKFDSSVDRGQKFTFTIGAKQVIKGWEDGLKNMKIGEKRKLTIPYSLAYGERGIPGVIPPKATLIFEVELFNVT